MQIRFPQDFQLVETPNGQGVLWYDDGTGLTAPQKITLELLKGFVYDDVTGDFLPKNAVNAANGVAALDAQMALQLNGTSVLSYDDATNCIVVKVKGLRFEIDMETSDPHVNGQLYVQGNSGVVCISRG